MKSEKAAAEYLSLRVGPVVGDTRRGGKEVLLGVGPTFNFLLALARYKHGIFLLDDVSVLAKYLAYTERAGKPVVFGGGFKRNES